MPTKAQIAIAALDWAPQALIGTSKREWAMALDDRPRVFFDLRGQPVTIRLYERKYLGDHRVSFKARIVSGSLGVYQTGAEVVVVWTFSGGAASRITDPAGFSNIQVFGEHGVAPFYEVAAERANAREP